MAGSRIATALEALVRHADANYLLAKQMAEEQKAHNAEQRRILTEDLQFRREQAEKSEQQQAMILRMFLGGPGPAPPPRVAEPQTTEDRQPLGPDFPRRKRRKTSSIEDRYTRSAS